MKKPDYKVSVRCFTYNQAKYIVEAMDGFTMQRTDFPFVCTIVDDASTDGEQEIIGKYVKDYFDLSTDSEAYSKETDYAHITYARHKTNRNCYFAVLYLKENHYSIHKSKLPYLEEWTENVPYMALCEGDDYWINPQKLQKQYDILESHPEYSLCHHSHMIRRENEIHGRNVSVPQVMNLQDIAEHNCVATQTMFYRNMQEPLIPENFPFKYPVYQFFLNLRLAEYGDIIYIDEPMAVYRINSGGIFSMQSRRRQVTMAVGNIENMMLWFTKGHPRMDIVKILKARALGELMINLKYSIKHLNIRNSYFFFSWYLRIKMRRK